MIIKTNSKKCPHFNDIECKGTHNIIFDYNGFCCDEFIKLDNGIEICKFYYNNNGFTIDIKYFVQNNTFNLNRTENNTISFNRTEALNKLYEKADKQEQERQKHNK